MPAISQWEDDDCPLVVNGRTLRGTATALKMSLDRGPGNGKESRVQTWKEVEEMEKGSEDANMAAVRKGRHAQESKTKQSNNKSNKQNQLTHQSKQPRDTDSSSSSLQMGQDEQTAAQREDRGEEDLRNHTAEGRAYPKRSNTFGRT